MDQDSFDKFIEELREAGGDGWDEVEDPLAFIREMRGEDELTDLSDLPGMFKDNPIDIAGEWDEQHRD